MIGDPRVFSWLSHRAGIKRLDKNPLALIKFQAIENSDEGELFIKEFGNKEIKGFVGFIDIVGFSERVKGYTPQKISEYLSPFLTSMINTVAHDSGLVDKTIGDEVMFILPDVNGAVNVSMMKLVHYIFLRGQKLGSDYPLRLGLSYGSLYVDKVNGEFSEWTIVGEAVHLAKRLMCEIGDVTSIKGAFGMFIKDTTDTKFENIIEWIVGNSLSYQIKGEINSLKGVSPAKWAILLSKH